MRVCVYDEPCSTKLLQPYSLFAASEALFVIGDFSRLSKLVDESLVKARAFDDKLNQLNNLVRSLAGQ